MPVRAALQPVGGAQGAVHVALLRARDHVVRRELAGQGQKRESQDVHRAVFSVPRGPWRQTRLSVTSKQRCASLRHKRNPLCMQWGPEEQGCEAPGDRLFLQHGFLGCASVRSVSLQV